MNLQIETAKERCDDCTHCVHPDGVCSYVMWKECVKSYQRYERDGTCTAVFHKKHFSPKKKHPFQVTREEEPQVYGEQWFKDILVDPKDLPEEFRPQAEAAIKRVTQAFDTIKRPEHYNYGKIQCWNWYELAMNDDEFRGAMKNNVWKYTFRTGHKGTKEEWIEDLNKAITYLERWIRFEKGDRTVVKEFIQEQEGKE